MARPRLEIGTWGKIGYIHQNGTVRAYANYRFADGSTAKRERSGKDEDEARRNLVRYLRSLGGGSDVTRSTTVKAVVEKWLREVHEQEKVTTFKRYKSCVNNHVVPAIGGLHLYECTTKRLQAVIDAQRKNGLGYSTLVMTRVVLRAVFSFAVVDGLADINPARELKRIKRTDKKRIRAFKPAELQAFLTAIDGDEQARGGYLPAMLRFMFGTGCRIGEALALRWCDLNLTDDPVQVEHAVFGDQELPPHAVWVNGNLVHGEGALVRHDGKTDGSEGIVGLPGFLVDLLLFLRPADADPSAPVFPTAKGVWRGPNVAHRDVRELCDRIGYEDFTSRLARKTVATWLRSMGQSPQDVRDQLRHSSVATAEKHYVARVANPAAGAAIEQLFAPVPGERGTQR